MDVSQDVIVTEADCGTVQGLYVETIYSGDEESAPLSTRIYGRVSCERVVDPVSNEVIVEVNELITEEKANRIEDIGHERLKIHPALTCESKRGCCQAHCYGLNLATGEAHQDW